MKKLNYRELVCLCAFVYFISYVTRINYSAALVAIVQDLEVTKQLAGIAVTGSFITYGLGQPISGALGDRIKPRKIITFGLVATALVNLGMGYMPNIGLMIVLWCFNGFFQALLWPPLVRLMAENMEAHEYGDAVFVVTSASSIAAIFVYFMVPVTIAFSSWRMAFVIAGVGALVISFVWHLGTLGVNENTVVVQREVETPKTQSSNIVLWVSLIPIMLAITLQGMLRDGITTWMPAYISEVYNLGASVSILTTAILPLFSILCLSLATKLYRCVSNELKTSAILFGFGFLAAVILLLCFSKSITVSVFMMALLTGCMHGVNLMLIGRLPIHFIQYGKVSTISGLLNACTYIGSALSIYGFAAFTDSYGWNFTILSWVVITFFGAAICLFCIKKCNKFCR